MKPTDSRRTARKRRRHAHSREAIVASALEAISEVGPDRLSLRDVARRAGYAPATIYEYFTDKAEMIAAVQQSISERLTAACADLEPADPLSELRQLGLRYLAFSRHHPADFRALFLQLDGKRKRFDQEPEASSAYLLVRERVEALIAQDLIDVPLDGAEHKAEHVAYMFWGLLHGLAVLQLTHLSGFDADFERTDRAAIDTFLAGLQAQAPSR